MITEISSEMKTEEPKAWNAAKHSKLQEGCSIVFHQSTTKTDLQSFVYEVILPKSKLNDLIQLREKKNQIKFFSLCHTQSTRR